MCSHMIRRLLSKEGIGWREVSGRLGGGLRSISTSKSRRGHHGALGRFIDRLLGLYRYFAMYQGSGFSQFVNKSEIEYRVKPMPVFQLLPTCIQGALLNKRVHVTVCD